MSEYLNLDDVSKVEEAIKFIAIGQPLPKDIETFLKREHLYDILLRGEASVTQHEEDVDFGGID